MNAIENLHLVKPDEKYNKSFEDYVKSYESEDEYYFNKYRLGLEDFNSYLNVMDDYYLGINLPEGMVKTSHYWLVANDDVVGVVRVRHEGDEFSGHIGYDISPKYRKKGYGNNILKLSLCEAAKLGINEVIITCNTENIASRKIIENNKGILLGTVFDEEEDEYLYKFKIVI